MRRGRAHARRAFTLVELLVGLMISVLLAGAATTAYLASAQSWDKSRSRTASYQYARAALDVIERHLHAAIPPNAESGIMFEGESAVITDTELAADSLRFSTTGGAFAPARFGASDLCEVTFYLDVRDDVGEPSLMMRRSRFASLLNEDYPREEEELAARVVSFDVSYHDGIEFVPEWFEDTLPAAVRFTLVLYDFDSEESPVTFHRTISLRRY